MGSGLDVPDLMSHLTRRAPLEMHYSIWSDAKTDKGGGGGLRTAVASALLRFSKFGSDSRV